MASRKPVAPVKPAPKAPVVAPPGPKAPVVAPGPSTKAPVVAPPPTRLGPNDIEVKTWDEAEKEYRTRLFALLVKSLNLKAELIKQGPDPFNNTPLNAIMAQVPVHLLEHSKTGVCEINITVKLMSEGKEIVDKTRTPVVKVNLDGRNHTSERPQPPHIGFSISLERKAESHVFVKDPLPTGLTVRGAPRSKVEAFATATLETKRGKLPEKSDTDTRDTWKVTAEIHRRSASAP